MPNISPAVGAVLAIGTLFLILSVTHIVNIRIGS